MVLKKVINSDGIEWIGISLDDIEGILNSDSIQEIKKSMEFKKSGPYFCCWV
jgi:hypothetical protein